jgi:hypothetical protein
MPTSLRNVAVLHSTVLVLLIASALITTNLPAFGVLAIVMLTPLGPLLFLDRPLMWQMAKNTAYLFAFLTGVWLMYSVLDIHSLWTAIRSGLLAVLALYLIGVGGYLKSDTIRRHFQLVPPEQPATEQ